MEVSVQPRNLAYEYEHQSMQIISHTTQRIRKSREKGEKGAHKMGEKISKATAISYQIVSRVAIAFFHSALALPRNSIISKYLPRTHARGNK